MIFSSVPQVDFSTVDGLTIADAEKSIVQMRRAPRSSGQIVVNNWPDGIGDSDSQAVQATAAGVVLPCTSRARHLLGCIARVTRSAGIKMRMFIKKIPAMERHRRETLENLSTAKGSYYSIAMQGHSPDSPIDSLVMKSFTRALTADSKLPAYVRDINGMSGQIYRSFINNLVGDHPDPRYLEIGCWAGSTAAAALYGNKAKSLCVDNWSLFGGPKKEFFANIERVRSSDIDFKFLERDFRSIDYRDVGTFNIYMFDGPHEERDQYDGVKLVQSALDETYILIVDDWNWSPVRDGTLQALVDTKGSIQSSIEVRTTFNNEPAPNHFQKSDWHNGYFIAVVQKG